jgi:homoserine dehydrogenase
VDLARLLPLGQTACRYTVPALGFQNESLQSLPTVPSQAIQTGAYLRLKVAHETGVLNQITTLLAQAGIGVDAVLQKEASSHEVDIMLLTHEVAQGLLQQTVAALEALPCVKQPVVWIRKEHF